MLVSLQSARTGADWVRAALCGLGAGRVAGRLRAKAAATAGGWPGPRAPRPVPAGGVSGGAAGLGVSAMHSCSEAAVWSVLLVSPETVLCLSSLSATQSDDKGKIGSGGGGARCVAGRARPTAAPGAALPQTS